MVSRTRSRAEEKQSEQFMQWHKRELVMWCAFSFITGCAAAIAAVLMFVI